jgi:hypothetical protein
MVRVALPYDTLEQLLRGIPRQRKNLHINHGRTDEETITELRETARLGLITPFDTARAFVNGSTAVREFIAKEFLHEDGEYFRELPEGTSKAIVNWFVDYCDNPKGFLHRLEDEISELRKKECPASWAEIKGLRDFAFLVGSELHEENILWRQEHPEEADSVKKVCLICPRCMETLVTDVQHAMTRARIAMQAFGEALVTKEDIYDDEHPYPDCKNTTCKNKVFATAYCPNHANDAERKFRADMRDLHFKQLRVIAEAERISTELSKHELMPEAYRQTLADIRAAGFSMEYEVTIELEAKSELAKRGFEDPMAEMEVWKHVGLIYLLIRHAQWMGGGMHMYIWKLFDNANGTWWGDFRGIEYFFDFTEDTLWEKLQRLAKFEFDDRFRKRKVKLLDCGTDKGGNFVNFYANMFTRADYRPELKAIYSELAKEYGIPRAIKEDSFILPLLNIPPESQTETDAEKVFDINCGNPKYFSATKRMFCLFNSMILAARAATENAVWCDKDKLINDFCKEAFKVPFSLILKRTIYYANLYRELVKKRLQVFTPCELEFIWNAAFEANTARIKRISFLDQQGIIEKYGPRLWNYFGTRKQFTATYEELAQVITDTQIGNGATIRLAADAARKRYSTAIAKTALQMATEKDARVKIELKVRGKRARYGKEEKPEELEHFSVDEVASTAPTKAETKEEDTQKKRKVAFSYALRESVKKVVALKKEWEVKKEEEPMQRSRQELENMVASVCLEDYGWDLKAKKFDLGRIRELD